MRKHLIRFRWLHLLFLSATHALVYRLFIDYILIVNNDNIEINRVFYIGTIIVIAAIIGACAVTDYQLNSWLKSNEGKKLGMYYQGVAKLIPISIISFGSVWIHLGIQSNQPSLSIVGIMVWVIMSPTFMILIGFSTTETSTQYLMHNCYYHFKFDKNETVIKPLIRGWYKLKTKKKGVFSYIDYENREMLS